MATKKNDNEQTGQTSRTDASANRTSWNDELLTTRELMGMLNLSRTKIWELVNKSDLPAFKIGGDYRYRRSEVLEWLERFRVNNEQS